MNKNMSKIFVNEAKKQRAIKALKDEQRALHANEKGFVAPEPTEEQIQELYLKYGGLIREVEDVPVVPTVEERVEKLEEIVAPIKDKVEDKPKVVRTRKGDVE